MNEPPLTPEPLTPGQALGQARWAGKSMAEKRAHAMMMVRARRKKLRDRAHKRKGEREERGEVMKDETKSPCPTCERKDEELEELRTRRADVLNKQEMLGILIQTPDRVYSFEDGEYVVTGRGAPVQELQETLQALVDSPGDPHVRHRAIEVVVKAPRWDEKRGRCKTAADYYEDDKARQPAREGEERGRGCGCELHRESGPWEGHGKDELRKLRDELRKQREELRELHAELADAYIRHDGLGNFIQTQDGIFLIRGWGYTS